MNVFTLCVRFQNSPDTLWIADRAFIPYYVYFRSPDDRRILMSTSVDQHNDDNGNEGLTRRQMIRRTAAAGAVAWTAPVLLSSTVHADGSPVVLVCPPGGSAATGDKPNTMTYEWNNGVWAWTTCTVGGVQADGRDIPGTPPPDCGVVDPLYIKAYGEPLSPAIPATSAVDGGNFTLTNLQGGNSSGQPNNNLSIYFVCMSTSPFTLAVLNNKTEAELIATGLFRRVTVHISCSQSLCLNDVHGAFTLKAVTTVNNP